MRVADSTIYQNATMHTNNARGRFVGASDRLSSGMRITHPGEDPIAASRAAQQQTAVMQIEAISRNIEHSLGEVGVADATLGNVTELITRARELAVQLANDSYSTTDRAGAALEVENIIASLTAQMNTTYGDRYIFAGSQTDAPPFDIAGNYAGDAQLRQIEVAPGVYEEVNVNADVAIKGAGGGVDVYAVLDGLRTALLADDANAIRAQLTGLDTSLDQVTLARVEVGNTTRIFETARSAAEKVADQGRLRVSELLEQDFVEGGTALAEAENALNAVLTASAKTFKLSLLDKL